jgi:hypothetical protein
MRWALLGLVPALVVGCLRAPELYTHSRSDYGALRARVGPLPEPNYLPFVAHRERLPDGSEAFVFCRWADSAFPLRYYVAPPDIPDDLEDEFIPRVPADYVAAIHRAFQKWERVIGRPVRFLSVDDPREAAVSIHLEVEQHIEREFRVAGMLHNEEQRCRVVGIGSDRDSVEIELHADDVYVFLLDESGLLTPGQVERVMLHEIGHVLGASGEHSPLRADLMFAAAHDRRHEEFSEHDQNTFHAVYRIRPGEIYVRIGEQHASPPPTARMGPPRLDRPIRDPRFGLELRLPIGWQVIRTPQGWIAVDGVSWDYDASIQIIAMRGTLSGYFARYGLTYLARGDLVGADWLELDGRPMVRVVLRSGERTEETTAIEWGSEKILVIVADTSDTNFPAYQLWFRHVVLSLEQLTDEPESASGSGSSDP